MTDEKHDAFYWARAKNIHVADPNGWRLDDGVVFTTPITEAEFVRRAAMSTIRNRPEATR